MRRVADLLSAKDETVDTDVYNKWRNDMIAAMSDNLKTASVLVLVQDFAKSDEINNATKLALMNFVDELLGLQFVDRAQKLVALEQEAAPDEIVALAQQRAEAKTNKDWGMADSLRAQIDAAGWTILDTKDGYKIVKKV